MDNLITVDFSESRFICNIVGLGAIQPKEILLTAIDILDNKYAALEEAMNKLL
jgi:hypothetical protein